MAEFRVVLEEFVKLPVLEEDDHPRVGFLGSVELLKHRRHKDSLTTSMHSHYRESGRCGQTGWPNDQ
jgi:hypothetical protein